MATITISRQLGSLGSTVARIVSDLLGYSLVDRELIDKAARRAKVPEMSLAVVDEFGFFDLCPSEEECRAYIKAIGQVIREFAVHGNIVILGRAGQVILHDHEDALHVRIIAPIEVRIRNLVKTREISPHGAAEQIKASDKFRGEYLRKYYQADLNDPTLYDLVINMSRISPQQAAGMVIGAIGE